MGKLDIGKRKECVRKFKWKLSMAERREWQNSECVTCVTPDYLVDTFWPDFPAKLLSLGR